MAFSSRAQYLEHLKDFSLGLAQGMGDACLSASLVHGGAWLVGSEKSFANSFVHILGWGSQSLRVMGPRSDIPFVFNGTINKDNGINYASGFWVRNPFGDVKSSTSMLYSAIYYTSFFSSIVVLGILSVFWNQKAFT